MNKRVRAWIKYLKSRGIENDLITLYTDKISNLQYDTLPIIFEEEHLSYLTGIKVEVLYRMIHGSSSFYRTFYIEKKSSNELREITAPYPSLLSIQKWINTNILSKVTIHYNAHGYIKNKSIKTNAIVHLGQKELFKIDLKNFFPSISKARVINQFRKLGYSKKVSFYLSSLCCYKDNLTQGSPTSPTLSNMIAFKLDKRLSYLARKTNLKYSRYADDIAFSGDNIHYNLQKLILKIIKDEGFKINHKKTYLNNETSNNRILTGLSIKRDRISIPRKMKREIKQEVFYISKYGLKSHMINTQRKDLSYYDSLVGKLQYWKYIEPDSEEVNKLIMLLERE